MRLKIRDMVREGLVGGKCGDGDAGLAEEGGVHGGG